MAASQWDSSSGRPRTAAPSAKDAAMKLPHEEMVKWQHDLGSTSAKTDSAEAKGPSSKRPELFTSRSPTSRGNTCQSEHGTLIANGWYFEKGLRRCRRRFAWCAAHRSPSHRLVFQGSKRQHCFLQGGRGVLCLIS